MTTIYGLPQTFTTKLGDQLQINTMPLELVTLSKHKMGPNTFTLGPLCSY